MLFSKLRRSVSRMINPTLKKRLITFVPRNIRSWYLHHTADIFIVSFPKCGRTWLRLIIGKALEIHFGVCLDDPLELSRFSLHAKHIPTIRVTHEDDPFWKRPDELSKNKTKYKHKKIIFLVREPKDVIVSSYFEKSKREKKYKSTLSEFVYDKIGSTETLINYYNIWLESKNVLKSFLLVKYEELHSNPASILREIFDFMGMEIVSDEVIYQAIQYASFENMRKLEKENAFSSDRLKPGSFTDEESFKTRSGQIGGFIKYLGDQEIDFINSQIKEKLNKDFGY